MKAFLLAALMALSQPREVKVYLNVPNVGHSEEFALLVQAELKLLDEEDKHYQLKWEPDASKADFIITLIMDKDKETDKFMSLTHMWGRRNATSKAFECLNQQLNRDRSAIAGQVAKVLRSSMRLEPEMYGKYPK